MSAPRVLSCRAADDYSLWLEFEDGIAGTVHLDGLVEIGAFRAWRNTRLFMTARVDPETHTVCWTSAGIRLDPELLYQHLVQHEGYTRGAVRRASAKPPPAQDAGFQRFMRAVLEDGRRRHPKGKP